MRLATITMSLALLLAGCGSFQIGGNFDLAAFEAKVERGKSTQSDVQRWLGNPDSRGVSVETDGARYTQWTYYYGTGNLSGPTNARVKLLQVKFDRAGVVRAYNWSGQAR
jgi:outer membrane protein assembly factor BamE (lipoprotein component of BamABCDE complex)